VTNFDYSDLGTGSFPCERISAQGAAAAHFVAPVRERKVASMAWMPAYIAVPNLLSICRWVLYTVRNGHEKLFSLRNYTCN
jgi:hypothetical protein